MTKQLNFLSKKKFKTQINSKSPKWRSSSNKNYDNKGFIDLKGFKKWFYMSDCVPRYLMRYKKIKTKFFWKKYWKRMQTLKILKFHYKMKFRIRDYFRCYLKRTKFRNNQSMFSFSNLQKMWWCVFTTIRIFAAYKARLILTPEWKKHGWFMSSFKLNYTQFPVWHLKKQMYWQKLRKRWIWHRLIKRSVQTQFLSNLKKYFSYNIAIRKYFKKILPSYNDHGKILYQQIPYFMVQTRLVPVVKHAMKIVRNKKVSVNGEIVNVDYIMKPFDMVRFNFKKAEIMWKYWRRSHKRKYQKFLKFKKGLIYNRKIRMYIFYRNLNKMPRQRISYLYYFYFYRNLLQPCRMR